jgi:hypothetical protein
VVQAKARRGNCATRLGLNDNFCLGASLKMPPWREHTDGRTKIPGRHKVNMNIDKRKSVRLSPN